MDSNRIPEIISKLKKEQAKKYYICMNRIIKENNAVDNKKQYIRYFLERNK